MIIRPYDAQDLAALYTISLRTGNAGADASRLYMDRRMIGHIYSAPYARLEPDLTLIVEEAGDVAGFIVGSADTCAWEARLEREWWPALRLRYADPDPTQQASWTADQRRAFMIHHPTRTPPSVSKRHPAHLHMNLLPGFQGRGVGPRLFEAWLDVSESRRMGTLHVGINPANAGAIRFWRRRGFAPLEPSGTQESRTLWMGQDR